MFAGKHATHSGSKKNKNSKNKKNRFDDDDGDWETESDEGENKKKKRNAKTNRKKDMNDFVNISMSDFFGRGGSSSSHIPGNGRSNGNSSSGGGYYGYGNYPNNAATKAKREEELNVAREKEKLKAKERLIAKEVAKSVDQGLFDCNLGLKVGDRVLVNSK